VTVPDVGTVDLVLVDGDGVITLVECKPRANPQIRREVVCQILAYASGLQGLSYDEFDDAFSARVGRRLVVAVSEVNTPVAEDALREAVGSVWRRARSASWWRWTRSPRSCARRWSTRTGTSAMSCS
jgi:hypothetical protein